MTNPNIQIDDLIREMTNDEYKSYLSFQSDYASQEQERKAKLDARSSALAKLAALGLTEEEIAAL
jgi:DNA-binding NarL/FixJ family response regulator